jgi:hypothetical protein
MTSAEFDAIKLVIETKPPKAIKAKWKNGPERQLWPHVLGTNPAGGSDPPVEVVLCLEYAEDDDGEPIKKFRCFKVEHLTIVGNPITSPWTPIPKMRFKQVKKQNCVDDVEVYR